MRCNSREYSHDFWHKKGFELDKLAISMHNACMSLSQHATQHTDTSDQVHFVHSYAKINLTLDVLGRRSDGYHELTTVMQTIDLYDTICLHATSDNSVRVICSQADLSNENNMAVRAAQALRQRFALSQGVVIELYKRVPVAAGLGGGSSNAAAVLLALQRWWHLPLSSVEMLILAASLGSDVPFFLAGGLALCEGRGEQVIPLAPYWPTAMRWFLLVKPSISLSTAEVFRYLSANDYTDGTHSRAVCTALQHGREPQVQDLHNSLEHSVLLRYPVVAQAKDAMLQAGASFVHLSGSGSTLFAPFSDLQCATRAHHHLLTQGYEVYLSHAVYPENANGRFFVHEY